MKDTELSDALGYDRVRYVRNLIKVGLESGEISRDDVVIGRAYAIQTGNDIEVYELNDNAAFQIAVKSDAPNAVAVRLAVHGRMLAREQHALQLVTQEKLQIAAEKLQLVADNEAGARTRSAMTSHINHVVSERNAAWERAEAAPANKLQRQIKCQAKEIVEVREQLNDLKKIHQETHRILQERMKRLSPTSAIEVRERVEESTLGRLRDLEAVISRLEATTSKAIEGAPCTCAYGKPQMPFGWEE